MGRADQALRRAEAVQRRRAQARRRDHRQDPRRHQGAARQGRLSGRAQGQGRPMDAALTPDAVLCEHVSVRFTTERGTVTALENIDLTIPRGSFLTLLGPSGCGKSTLLRVMADLIEPSSGKVTVLGDVPETARVSREIGFVFQDAALLPWRNVLDNVTLPLEVGGGKALPGARSPQELISLVGLAGW